MRFVRRAGGDEYAVDRDNGKENQLASINSDYYVLKREGLLQNCDRTSTHLVLEPSVHSIELQNFDELRLDIYFQYAF